MKEFLLIIQQLPKHNYQIRFFSKTFIIIFSFHYLDKNFYSKDSANLTALFMESGVVDPFNV